MHQTPSVSCLLMLLASICIGFVLIFKAFPKVQTALLFLIKYNRTEVFIYYTENSTTTETLFTQELLEMSELQKKRQVTHRSR